MAAPNRSIALPSPRFVPRWSELGWRELLEMREATIVVVLIAMSIVLGILYPQFRTLENVDNILQAVAQVAIVGVGMTMVIVTGGIDVSVGSALSVCAVVVGLRLQHGAGAPEAIVEALAAAEGMPAHAEAVRR
jgi:ribose transport system permease protein